MSEDRDLAAGDFSTWLVAMEGALNGDHGSDVPCGTCTACCTSSQFIHIEPDETDTLAHIPKALRFPAPRLPAGHVLLGYDQRGHCPMLIDEQCSIYEHRPRTCRTYDCRVFPAAGLDLDDDKDKALIARQARRWTFSLAAPTDQTKHDAVRAAAAFIRDHPDALPDSAAPPNTTQLAVLAIELYRTFLRDEESSGTPTVFTPEPHAVRVELTRRMRPRTAPG